MEVDVFRASKELSLMIDLPRQEEDAAKWMYSTKHRTPGERCSFSSAQLEVNASSASFREFSRGQLLEEAVSSVL